MRRKTKTTDEIKDYLNQQYPINHVEIDSYDEIILKYHKLDIGCWPFSPYQKREVQSMIDKISEHLKEEFVREGFIITPMCVVLQEKLYSLKSMLDRANHIDDTKSLAILSITSSFDMEQLKPKAKYDDLYMINVDKEDEFILPY